MMLVLLLVLAATVGGQTANNLDVRTGVVQLQMGGLQQAAYHIVYAQPLADDVYNSMTTISYATGLDRTLGIVATSGCYSMTAAKMDCTVTANGNNQNNVVYVSFIASNIGSLLVGTHAQTFSFVNTNLISTTVTFAPQVQENSINYSNSQQFWFYPMIAGVSSLDSDFSVNIVGTNFNSVELKLSISLLISEMHALEVTIYLGYVLWDAGSKVSVSSMKQTLNPGNVPDYTIYGISGIFSISNPHRRLQSAPSPPADLAKALPIIPATNAVTIHPTVKKHNTSSAASPPSYTTPAPPVISPYSLGSPLPSVSAGLSPGKRLLASKSSSYVVTPSAATNYTTSTAFISQRAPKLTPEQFTPPQPSAVAQSLRNSLKDVILIPQANTKLFESVMQSDRVIDATAASMAILSNYGFFPPIINPIINIDNQFFNTIFSTNGFTIITSSDDIDVAVQLSVQNGNTRSAGAGAGGVLYQTVVTNWKPAFDCQGGVVQVKPKKVDYIQETMILQCLKCIDGFTLDYFRQICIRDIAAPTVPDSSLRRN